MEDCTQQPEDSKVHPEENYSSDAALAYLRRSLDVVGRPSDRAGVAIPRVGVGRISLLLEEV